MALTTSIQIDTQLLERLGARRPGKDARELIEDLARIELGFATRREVQQRNAVPEDEAMARAVRAVHDARGSSV